ncbi:MAG: Gfo/Idh/MocA family protein [Flavobacteriaceae bacterium]
MKKTLKAGVLGAGHLGKIHLRLLNESTRYTLVGFYDPDVTASKALAESTGYTYFERQEDLIAACDVIDIVTPTLYHHAVAKDCIAAGKHIFIEKPITHTVEEAEELVELAREKGIKGQVGHVERFNPAFKAVKDNLGQPMFVESHRLAEFNPRGTDVSVVLDLMIHDIDIILSVIQSPVKHISASGVAVVSETPDIANARIAFENGAVANLTASRISLKNMRKLRFFQKEAYISVDFFTKQVEVVKMKEADEQTDEFALVLQNAEGVKKEIYFDPPVVEQSNAILEELETFADAIEEDSEPIVPLTHATEALRVAQKIIDCF